MIEAKVIAALIGSHATPAEAANAILDFLKLCNQADEAVRVEQRRAKWREQWRARQGQGDSKKLRRASKEGTSLSDQIFSEDKSKTQSKSGPSAETLKSPEEPPPPDFVAFWQAYPRKTAKAAALGAWRKARPPLAECLKTLGWQVKQASWKKDKGEFIPHPATWLNGHRWQDEPPRGSVPVVAQGFEKIFEGDRRPNGAH